MLGTRFAAAQAAEPRPPELRAAGRRLLPAAQAFYRRASAETAAALLEVSLRHPHELVRVSAAASYFEVTTTPAAASFSTRRFATRWTSSAERTSRSLTMRRCPVGAPVSAAQVCLSA